jgi:hypothetical protein
MSNESQRHLWRESLAITCFSTLLLLACGVSRSDAASHLLVVIGDPGLRKAVCGKLVPV